MPFVVRPLFVRFLGSVRLCRLHRRGGVLIVVSIVIRTLAVLKGYAPSREELEARSPSRTVAEAWVPWRSGGTVRMLKCGTSLLPALRRECGLLPKSLRQTTG